MFHLWFNQNDIFLNVRISRIKISRIYQSRMGWWATSGCNKRWINWKSNIPLVSKTEIPKWCGFIATDKGQSELHVFSDALQYVYAAIVFIRYILKIHIYIYFFSIYFISTDHIPEIITSKCNQSIITWYQIWINLYLTERIIQI